LQSLFLDRCLTLFCEAERLLEESRAADMRMDYASALQLCLEATKTIENILMTENLPEEYLIKARIKHGDCVNKSNSYVTMCSNAFNFAMVVLLEAQIYFNSECYCTMRNCTATAAESISDSEENWEKWRRIINVLNPQT